MHVRASFDSKAFLALGDFGEHAVPFVGTLVI